MGVCPEGVYTPGPKADTPPPRGQTDTPVKHYLFATTVADGKYKCRIHKLFSGTEVGVCALCEYCLKPDSVNALNL